MLRWIALLIAAAAVAAPVSAQGVLDRKVGLDAFGRPLEFRAFTTHDVGAFGQAAQLPIGFEALAAPKAPMALPALVLTGRTVRDAIAAMLAVDARYQWREDEGVILFEPAGPTPMAPVAALPGGSGHPLEAQAPAVRIGETNTRTAFAIVAALLGAPRSTAIAVADTKPFVLDAPVGTIRELLNAIVRAHGQGMWQFEMGTRSTPPFPCTLLFASATGGFGLGLPGYASEPLDLARFVPTKGAAANILDTVIGPRDGRPLVLSGLWPSAARELSAATGVPFGMQVAPRRGGPEHYSEYTATGKTLREALDLLASRDTRYEWRVVDGTIVIRPAAAWSDAQDPLFAIARDVDLHDVSTTRAFRAVESALGGRDPALTAFPDSRTMSLSVLHGSALDLLTALVRGHGSLSWTLEDAEPDEIRQTGRQHRLTVFAPAAAGVGVLVR